MPFARIVCCVLVGAALLGQPVHGQEPTWKAGVAKAIITPEKGVWLAGYGSKRPPDGKLHEKQLAVVPSVKDQCKVLALGPCAPKK